MNAQYLLTAQAILKDYYVSPIIDQMNRLTYLLDRVQRDSTKIDHTGKRAVFPVRLDGNHSRKELKDGPDKSNATGTQDLLLPEPDPQNEVDATVYLRYNAWAVGISDPAIQASATNQGAFISVVDDETQGVAKDAKKEMNKLAFGTVAGFEGLAQFAAEDRTLHAIDSTVAGQENWDGIYEDASGHILTEDTFGDVNDRIGEASGETPEVWITRRGTRRHLSRQYQNNKQFVDAQAVTLRGGYTAIYVDNIPVVADDDCPADKAFAINSDYLRWHEQAGGPGWLEKADASIWHLRVVAGAGANAGRREAIWDAYWRWYAAFACTRPNTQGQIDKIDLTATTP